MSNFKPYWERHPLQLRLFALTMLITSPITFPVLLLWAYRDEIHYEIKINYRHIWKLLTGKLKP